MFYNNLEKIRWINKKITYLGVAFLGISTLLLPGCEFPQQDAQITNDEIITNDNGQKTTVRRLVQDPIGEYGFLIEAEPGEPSIVVNVTGEIFMLLNEEIPIQATGEVKELSLAEIEREYGLNLEEELYAEYENEPVLVAESLAFAPTPEILAEFPLDFFLDKQIAVEGELRQIDEAPNAFALYEEGWFDQWGVLVIAVDEDLKARGTPLEEGGNLTVTGVARQFSRELVQEAGFDWDEAQIAEFEQRYTERPVIVADGVYPSATSPAPGS